MKKIYQRDYDVILLDHHLPDADGLTILKKLLRSGILVPVVIVTSTEDEKLVLEALRIGAADFLKKQGDYLAALPAILKRIVAESHQRRRLKEKVTHKQRHILYVESNRKDIHATRRHFTAEAPNFSLKAVTTGHKALELLEKSDPYDLVLVTSHLDDMSALEFQRQARHRDLDLPIVILADIADEEMAVVSLRYGAYDYIVKNTGYLTHLIYAIDHAITRFQLDLINRNLQEELGKINLSLEEKVQERTKELRASEERFRWITDNAFDLIAIVSQEGQFIYASPSYYYQLGHLTSELVGNQILSLIHPNDRDEFLLRMKDLQITEVPYTVECRLVNKSGQWRIFEATLTLVEDETAGPEKIIVVSRDITVRKKTEAALASSEARYRNLAKRSPVGIFQCNANRFCIFVNEYWSNLTGLLPTEAMGEGWMEAIYEEDRLPLLDEWERSVQRGQNFKCEYRIRRKDNSVIWVYGEAAPVRDEEGTVTGYIESIIDITERKKAEEALRESEARYRSLVDLSPEAIVVHSGGMIVYINDSGIKMFGGHHARDFLGKPMIDFVHPDYRQMVIKRVQDIYQGISRQEALSEKFIRLDGQIIDAEVSAAAITYDGKPAVQVIVRDVTDRVVTEQQLRRIRKMEAVGRLAGGIAQDFDDSLTIINSYAQLLLKECRVNAQQRQDLQELLEAGNKAARLTKQLLVFSRRQIIHPQVLDINAILREMAPLFKRLIGPGIALQMELGERQSLVYTDRNQIEQALVNLTLNARDAMPNGGVFRIETGEVALERDTPIANVNITPGEYVLISVSDNGQGIDPALESHIFDPFFTTKDPERYSGLGLSTVYGIVKQSHGYIGVYTELDRGTTFKIFLPRTSLEASESGRDEQEPVSLAGEETLLIVEDNPALQRVMIRSLETFGYKVLAASGAEEASNLLADQHEQIDLVIADIHLFQESGVEPGEPLWAQYPHLRILYLSDYSEKNLDVFDVQSGRFGFIQKPFNPEGLARRVRQMLGSKKTTG